MFFSIAIIIITIILIKKLAKHVHVSTISIIFLVLKLNINIVDMVKHSIFPIIQDVFLIYRMFSYYTGCFPIIQAVSYYYTGCFECEKAKLPSVNV